MSPRFRIAPSPTGFFHVGGARTALYNWALARRLGGTFVLRIEDTDEARNRPEWTAGIIDALAWIGISADDPAFEGPYFQSANAAAHVAAAERLYADGPGLLLRPDRRADPGAGQGRRASPGYDGYSRDRGLGPGSRAGAALPGARRGHDGRPRRRPRRGRRSPTTTIEDFVLLRGNGTPMFLLANVVDDIEMGITHVVRAEEHLPNTPKQQLLWEALGHEPPAWAHVPVLVNEQRKKLSKRRDKVALEQYRDEGYLAEAMVNYLMTLGWAPKGDTEIVPWSRDRGRVPARGRHPLAGVLRPQEADARSTASTSGRCRSTTSSRPASRGSPSHYDRERRSPRMAPLVQSAGRDAGEVAGDGRLPVLDDPVDRRGVVGEGDGRPSGPARCSTA